MKNFLEMFNQVNKKYHEDKIKEKQTGEKSELVIRIENIARKDYE